MQKKEVTRKRLKGNVKVTKNKNKRNVKKLTRSKSNFKLECFRFI